MVRKSDGPRNLMSTKFSAQREFEVRIIIKILFIRFLVEDEVQVQKVGSKFVWVLKNFGSKNIWVRKKVFAKKFWNAKNLDHKEVLNLKNIWVP